MAMPMPRRDLETQSAPAAPVASATARLDRAGHAVVIPLGLARSLEVESAVHEAHLCIRDQQRALDITICFEEAGPVVRVRARELQLAGLENITATCGTFAVHARERIELHSGGDLTQRAQDTARIEGRQVAVEATPGAICLKANDEVQLLGEMILLNCDHPSTVPETPAWAAHRPTPLVLPTEACSGDENVIAEMQGR